ncbi:hypothetical protein Hanom_Chr14g01312661 [Helianthus anomalus]
MHFYILCVFILASFEDGGCTGFFLVDQTSYDQGRFPDPFIFKNASFFPISLLWALNDFNQVICCDGQTPDRGVVDMFKVVRALDSSCFL